MKQYMFMAVFFILVAALAFITEDETAGAIYVMGALIYSAIRIKE